MTAIDCIPERIEQTIRCRICKREWKLLDPGTPLDSLHRNCRRDELRLPPLRQRLANFSRALIAHEMAGSPTCTQEQIDERHAACKACELYLPDKDNPEIGHCCHESCGCPITRLDKYVSKLAWADQACPLGKWLAISPPKNPAPR